MKKKAEKKMKYWYVVYVTGGGRRHLSVGIESKDSDFPLTKVQGLLPPQGSVVLSWSEIPKKICFNLKAGYFSTEQLDAKPSTKDKILP